MELYRKVLEEALSKEELNTIFNNLKSSMSGNIKIDSYETLMQINEIMLDESLEDFEFFMKIGKIARALEEKDSDGEA